MHLSLHVYVCELYCSVCIYTCVFAHANSTSFKSPNSRNCCHVHFTESETEALHMNVPVHLQQAWGYHLNLDVLDLWDASHPAVLPIRLWDSLGCPTVYHVPRSFLAACPLLGSYYGNPMQCRLL